MNIELRDVLGKTIRGLLPILKRYSDELAEPHLVWTKNGEGWHGEQLQKPSLLQVFYSANGLLESVGAVLNQIVQRQYPERYQGFICCGGSGIKLDQSKSLLVSSIASTLWDRHGTFECDDTEIDAVVTECEQFLTLPTIPVRYYAQLINFSSDLDVIHLSEQVTIRRLNVAEMNALYGGSLTRLSFSRPQHHHMSEFVAESVFEEKIIQDASQTSNAIREQFGTLLEKALLCLRTFRAGFIGSGETRAEFQRFCPLGSCTTFGNEYIPFGSYRISSSELDSFREHASAIFKMSEPTLETACYRLATAATRIRPQDQILDAVIGMEALLLPIGGKGELKYKGESRYRFSLNYSSLFETPPERHRAFHIARDLYDHRSHIAHGGGPADLLLKFGTEKLPLVEIAKRAIEELRSLIRRMLPIAKEAPYRKNEFWERAYFGMQPDPILRTT
jgi:hypothetical protein